MSTRRGVSYLKTNLAFTDKRRRPCVVVVVEGQRIEDGTLNQKDKK